MTLLGHRNSLILLGSFLLGVSDLNESVTFSNQPLGVKDKLLSKNFQESYYVIYQTQDSVFYHIFSNINNSKAKDKGNHAP